MTDKKKVAFDMVLNIVAVAIPALALQFVILPAVSHHMPDSNYGLFVTLLAVLDVFPGTLGNVLNNIRLLYNNSYLGKNLEGDFNIILLAMAGVNLLIVSVFSILYSDDKSIIDILMIVVLSLLWLAKEYFIVAFRLKINYLAILINNVLQVAGYAAGYYIFLQTGKWQWIFLIGYFVSLVYIFIRCSLWKEKLVRTELIKKVTIQTVLLFIAGLLNRATTYADKILIYPIIGGSVVSVYHAATVFGKVVAFAVTPVNAVVLTYLAKMKKKPDNIFKTAFLTEAGLCVIGYVACVLISRPVLTLIYPQFVDSAMEYIYVTTATTAFYALVTIVNPFIMKFFDMKWQIAINGGAAALYVVLSLGMFYIWGLMGFCIGALITNALKLISMLIIFTKCRPKKYA